MKGTGADRRMWAAAIAAGAAMALCFALRSTAMTSLDPLPWEPPAPAQVQEEGLVDLNTAGLEELTALPGIGEVRARAILEDRAANGPYRYPEELIRVKGIGEGVLGAILDQITTGGDEIVQNTGG